MPLYEIIFSLKGHAILTGDVIFANQIKLEKSDPKSDSFHAIVMEEATEPKIATSTALQRLKVCLNFYLFSHKRGFEIEYDERPATISQIKDDKVVASHTAIPITIELPYIFHNAYLMNGQKYLELLGNPENQYLITALDYLNKSKHETDAENELIFLMISMESLYTKKDYEEKITEKISHRFSIIYGDNTEEEKDFKKRMRQLYKTRSIIIHGSTLKKGENIEILFEYVTNSIWKFMILSIMYPKKTHDEIIDLIDESGSNESWKEKIRKQIGKEQIKSEKENHQCIIEAIPKKE